jgi:RecA-family ATPase
MSDNPLQVDQRRISQHAQQYLERSLGQRRGNERLAEMTADEDFCLGPPMSYEQFLAVEYTTPQYRIDSLWPTGGTALLAAYRKTGKSTLVQNIIRCLKTGEPFLSAHVTPIDSDQTIVHCNFEVDERTQQYYARPFGGFPNVYIHNLRGRARQFNIVNDAIRSRIAAQLGDLNAAILVLDPLGPLLRSFGLDENRNSSDGGGAIVEAVNALSDEAHLSETLLVHHTGHGSQWRARGSSVFGDAPDVLWSYRLGRHKLEDASDEERGDIDPDARYFSATGRLESDFTEKRVYYNAKTHRIAMTPFIERPAA